MKFDIEDPRVTAKKKKAKKKKNDRMFFITVALLLLALILLVIYYVSLDSTPVSNPPAPKVIQQSKLNIVNENSNERPIAVMIDNNIGDIKHAGLQDSYINYEMIVEGGLTRIMAIYKDKEVDLIGPVRSARHYFLDYAMEHNAVYAHYGWSPYAEKDIKDLDVNNINGMTDRSPFVRDTNIAAPHNVFTSTTKLRNYFSEKGYSQEVNNWRVLNYSYGEVNLQNEIDGIEASTEVVEDESEDTSDNNKDNPANKVSLYYSNSQLRTYVYDSNNKYYLRYMNNKAHIDRASNKQLHFKNIIIVKVNNKNLDNEGRQDLDTIGSGDGYYITNGYMVPIKWEKDGRSSKSVYTTSNGEQIRVNDGNTFIQVVPVNSNIIIE